MKVCVITSMFPTKKAPHNGVFITRRIEGLIENGVEVDAFAIIREESFAVQIIRKLFNKETKEEFSDVIATDNDRIQYKTLKVRLGLLGFLLTTITSERYYARKAGEVCKKEIIGKYDIIHAHWLYPTGKAAVILSKAKNVPVFITCHGSDINRVMHAPSYRKDCIWTMKNADEVEFVSNKLMSTARSLGGEWNSAHVLPNGITDYSDEISLERDHIVGFVGNLIDVKRVDCFPELFRLLYNKYKELSFLIVGDGEKRKWLENELSGLPVVFTGRVPQDEVLLLMKKMEVMILPSRNEGWPCVVLEAHSCGTPVIGSSCGGIPEAIGDDSFIVEDNDNMGIFTNNLYERIVALIDHTLEVAPQDLIKRSRQYTWTNLQSIEKEEYQRYVKCENK